MTNGAQQPTQYLCAFPWSPVVIVINCTVIVH